MGGMKVSISLPDVLAERLDAARGDVPRSVFVRRAVEQALVTEGRGGSPGVSKAVLPAPAEQPSVFADGDPRVVIPVGLPSGVSRAAAFRAATQGKKS